MAPTFADLATLTQRKLIEGIELFNAGRWWHAHEAWEGAWRAEQGTTKLLLQALIQLAAAYHKGLRMGNPRGMARLFEAALEKLEAVQAVDPRWAGLDLAAAGAAARRGRDLAIGWADGRRAGFDAGAIPVLALPE